MEGPGTKFEAVLFKWISSPNQISDVHNHKCCSIWYANAGIIRAAKVCCGQPGCVATTRMCCHRGLCSQQMLDFILASLRLHGNHSFHLCNSSPSKECYILKIGQNFENRVKFWKLGKILKIGQNFENRAKFWKSGNFEARVISRQKLVPQISALFTKWRARGISSHKFSGTSARHFQMTSNGRRYAMFTRGP